MKTLALLVLWATAMVVAVYIWDRIVGKSKELEAGLSDEIKRIIRDQERGAGSDGGGD